MKRIGFAVILAVLVAAMLACGLLNTVVGGGSTYKPAAELWSDVPRMDGLTPSALEDMPVAIKLLMRTVFGNLGLLNGAGQDQTTGNVDWISFNSAGTPDDLKNFYTSDRMTPDGWVPTQNSPCLSGSDQGMPQVGTLCIFGKEQNGLQTYLVIIATQDETTKQNSAFFLRMEVAATPTP